MINAYNAHMIEKILLRYPNIKSVWDYGKVFGNPFKDKFFKLFGREFALDTIEHDTIRSVTPAMLRWWFENLGGSMSFGGRTYPRYLLWHPRDHIHWALARPWLCTAIGAGLLVLALAIAATLQLGFQK